ncbi:hypothetical protein [Polyangium sorediatum]|uniref:Tryptophan synthase alpha chain n=1 Tax=Polyangium sorediatum TaxID=889274 RepID=A0ABT6NKL6_9BACT|nr:hypothetical protein [Polyangium sorediatum]MDI1428818.1 hypothetical protein [Polyangium sorediatum]
MSSTNTPRALRAILASALVALVGGGCIALGYDFDRKPPLACSSVAECPGEDTFCGTRKCEQNVCTFVNVQPAGVKPLGQPVDDCQDLTCDGAGHAVSKPASDQPPKDASDCTEDKCVDGTPLFVPVDKDKPCGKGGALACDGLGSCAGCTAATDCGDDGPCVNWSCTEGVCLRVNAPRGTLVTDTVKGDCLAEGCDGDGNVVTLSFQDPMDDMDPCKDDICKDGVTVHEPAANGTPCAEGCRACTDGVCEMMCSPGFGCNDGVICKPLAQQPNGSACQEAIDCTSGSCVDGVCCENECSGKCMACSNQKTGQANGMCAPVIDGSNPDMDCGGSDVCFGGKCRCENGVKDGAELKVDCGGICAPCGGTWVCNGSNGCEGPIPACCSFEVNCFDCGNETADCSIVEGTLCTVEVDKPKSFTGGTFWDGCLKCKRMTCICQ